MKTRLQLVIVTGALIAVVPDATWSSQADPFAFIGSVVTLGQAERQRLKDDEVVVRILPGTDGHLGVMATARIDAPAFALSSWVREIEAYKESEFVVAIRRFSEPPALEDLAGLSLEAADIDAIRQCRAGSCSLKLAAPEIARLRTAADGRPGWQSRVQREFRAVVYDRVMTYRAGGLSALPAPADRRDARTPDEGLRAILDQHRFLNDQLPDVVTRLRTGPVADMTGADSFLYWSKEDYGAGKPVVAVTHVDIVRPAPPAPEVIVLTKEVFATHYRTGSLGVTAIVEGHDSSERYLVYVNRTRVDLLGGLFGGLKRKLIEGRLVGESTTLMRLVRTRLESGLPPVMRGS